MLSTDLIYEVGRKQSMIYSWKIFSQVCVFVFVGRKCSSAQVCMCLCISVFTGHMCSVHKTGTSLLSYCRCRCQSHDSNIPDCNRSRLPKLPNSPDTYFPVSVRRPRFSTMTAMRCNVGVIRARFNAAISEAPQPGLPGQCAQNCLEIVLIVPKY